MIEHCDIGVVQSNIKESRTRFGEENQELKLPKGISRTNSSKNNPIFVSPAELSRTVLKMKDFNSKKLEIN